MSKPIHEPYYCPLADCDHNEKGVCNIDGACDNDGQNKPDEEDTWE